MFVFGIRIEFLEAFLKHLVQFIYLLFKKWSENFLVFFLLLSMLGVFVAFEENLNSIDSVRNKLSPGYFAVWIFISESEQDSHVVFTEIILIKLFECFIECSVF